jgi:hypothetical protein
MKTQLFACILCLAASVAVRAADDLDKKYPVLASLRMPEKKLPADCKVTEIPANEKSLAGLKNLAITTDPKHFVIGERRLATTLDVKAIEAAYFGLYYQDGPRKWDLGVIAWACTDEAAAKKQLEALSKLFKDDPMRMRLFRAKNHVVWLWRDPGASDENFAAFESFVKEKVAAAEKK